MQRKSMGSPLGGKGGKPANLYKRISPADAIRERIEREERAAREREGGQ